MTISNNPNHNTTTTTTTTTTDNDNNDNDNDNNDDDNQINNEMMIEAPGLLLLGLRGRRRLLLRG